MAISAVTACNKDKEAQVEDGKIFPGDKDNILIEVTLPSSTSSTDVIYLAGAVTGGQENAAAFKLARSSKGGNVLAAYLDPNDFIGGKTLADPFWFVSKEKGIEVDASGNPATHTIADAKKGGAYSIEVKAWKGKSGGDTPGGDTPGGDTPGGDTPGGDTPGGDTPGGDTPGGDTPGGDTPGGDTPGGDTPGGDTPGGAKLYVYDTHGWGTGMHLWAWNETGNLTGSDWPGNKSASGTETVSGNEFLVFELDESFFGNIYIIFTNGSGAQTVDYGPVAVADGSTFFYNILSSTDGSGHYEVQVISPDSFTPGDTPGGDTPGGDYWSLMGNFGGSDEWSYVESSAHYTTEGEDTWEFKFTYTAGLLFKFLKNHDWAQGDYGMGSMDAVPLPFSSDVALTASGQNIELSGVDDGASLTVYLHLHKNPVDFWVSVNQ